MCFVATATTGFSIDSDLNVKPNPQALEQYKNEAGHQKMVALLHQIAKERNDRHPYFRTDRAQQLKHQLRNLPADTPNHERWKLHSFLGVAELRLGNTEASIENQLKAYQLLPKTHKTKYPGNYMRFQLGVAYLRLGETQNCCLRNTPESCIVPITTGGLHANTTGSEQAIHYFTQVLTHGVKERRDTNIYLSARWLINIAYMTIGAYPDGVPPQYLINPAVFESKISFPRFKNIAPSLGLNTFNLCGSVIVDDFNNDHYLDIISSTWDSTGQLKIFRNNGNGTFSHRTKEAGLAGLYGGLNIVSADYNNDGWLDILVLRGGWMFEAGRHPNSLIRNNGDGTFTDVTFDAGLANHHYPTQTAAWADYDNDGDLDLFIGNEAGGNIDFYIGDKPPTKVGRFSSEIHESKQHVPCQLFRNNGDGTFTDVAPDAGVDHPLFVKGVTWGDYDNDRWPDLYISTLNSPNRLYHNNADGTFTDVAPGAGVTKPISSFPTWFWDFDNDGNLDLFAASYSSSLPQVAAVYLGHQVRFEPPALYRGDGRGGFEDVSTSQNLNLPMQPMGSNFGDLNNDGYLDFYLGTGDINYHVLVPNMMFLNQGGGGFENVTMAGGFGHLQKGHGIAFADLDNDGDLDVFEQMGGAFPGDAYGDALFENPGFSNHWIGVKLVGTKSNRSAIGAKIHVRITENGNPRSIYRQVTSGGSFGSNPLRQVIGLGQSTKVDILEIFWPTTGHKQRIDNISAGQWLHITEGKESFRKLRLKPMGFTQH